MLEKQELHDPSSPTRGENYNMKRDARNIIIKSDRLP